MVELLKWVSEQEEKAYKTAEKYKEQKLSKFYEAFLSRGNAFTEVKNEIEKRLEVVSKD